MQKGQDAKNMVTKDKGTNPGHPGFSRMEEERRGQLCTTTTKHKMVEFYLIPHDLSVALCVW